MFKENEDFPGHYVVRDYNKSMDFEGLVDHVWSHSCDLRTERLARPAGGVRVHHLEFVMLRWHKCPFAPNLDFGVELVGVLLTPVTEEQLEELGIELRSESEDRRNGDVIEVGACVTYARLWFPDIGPEGLFFKAIGRLDRREQLERLGRLEHETVPQQNAEAA